MSGEDALFGERSQGPRSVNAECTEQQMGRGKTVGSAFALALVFVEVRDCVLCAWKLGLSFGCLLTLYAFYRHNKCRLNLAV